jgi:ABC-type branched-subunit amino acid transport system substrate-binding protein
VALRIEDDQSVDKRASLAATHRLVEVEKVDVVTVWSLSALEIIVPVTQKAQVPLLIGDYDDRIRRAGRDTFGSLLNRDLLPREVARFFRARGVRRVALIMIEDAWSASYEAPFRAEAQALGLDVVYVETLNPAESELRPVVLKLKSKRVEAVLAPLYGPSLFSFLRRHRELQAGGIVNVGDGLFEQDVSALGAVAEGVTSQQIIVKDDLLADKVRKRYGAAGTPLQLGQVAAGYDPVRHLVKAARELQARGEPITRTRLSEILKTYRSQGYIGPMMVGAAPELPGEQLVVVEKGRYQPVQY